MPELPIDLRNGLPHATFPKVDRLLVPSVALLDVGHPEAFLCSRAFAGVLKRLGIGGFRLRAVEHVAGGVVHGNACAWLEVNTVAGGVAANTNVAAIPNHARTSTHLGGTPLTPVVIDRTRATADDLGWTEEWFGTGVGAWRALLASERLIDALLSDDTLAQHDLLFGLDPVKVVAEPLARHTQAALSASWPLEPQAPSTDLRASSSQLHSLGVRVSSKSTRAHPRLEVEQWPDPALDQFLRENDGVVVLDGALEFFSATDRPGLAHATQTAARLGARPRSGDRVFAVSRGLGVFWAMGLDARVRGLSRTGTRYGPGSGFAEWLHDVLATLATASGPLRHTRWAVQWLGR